MEEAFEDLRLFASSNVDFYRPFAALLTVIDWSEPFILSIGALHLAFAIVVFLTRSNEKVQATLLAVLFLALFKAASINDYFVRNWESLGESPPSPSSSSLSPRHNPSPLPVCIPVCLPASCRAPGNLLRLGHPDASFCSNRRGEAAVL